MSCEIDALKTISIIKKTDNTFTVTAKTDGSPYGITGAVATLGVKKNAKDTNFVILNTGVITDAVNGIVTFTLTDTECDVPAGDYVYSIKLVELSGRISQGETQTFKILQGVQ